MSAPAAPEELQQPLLQREDEHKPPYHHQQQQQDTFWPCAINLTKVGVLRSHACVSFAPPSDNLMPHARVSFAPSGDNAQAKPPHSPSTPPHHFLLPLLLQHHCCQAITGAGMMAIPRAFFLVGWLPGTLMMAGVAALTTFTMAVLVQGSAAAGPGHASTYAELVQHTLGTTMMRLLQLAVLMFCFGFSVVYLVSRDWGPVRLCAGCGSRR